jgi:hypothetical protein
MEDENYSCYAELKNGLIKHNLQTLGVKKLGVTIRTNHNEFLKQYMYTYHTLGDYYLLSYFTHTCRASNVRLLTECACGLPNVEWHAASDCKIILETKRKQHDEIEKIHTKTIVQDSSRTYMITLLIYTLLWSCLGLMTARILKIWSGNMANLRKAVI